MATLASCPTSFARDSRNNQALEFYIPPADQERNCLVLSDDPLLIAAMDAAATHRSFEVHDYGDAEEAALAALFSPPALAVLDLRLAYEKSQLRQFVALCRQLLADRNTHVAIIGCTDDEREEKLFRQLGATYYFPNVPSPEEMEQLAISAAVRVRTSNRKATIETLRRAVEKSRTTVVEGRFRRAA
jgi:DNA-binding response OmpR family regulator